MTARRSPDAGFTLIETLIALAVLAVGAVTLLAGVERHAAAQRGLSDRIVARWVAENALAAARLDLPLAPAWAQAYGIGWRVDLTARQLDGTGLQAVTARVTDAAVSGAAPIFSLTGYVARGPGTP